jgi:BrnA antitoxin of type II toxin-antitoxin system
MKKKIKYSDEPIAFKVVDDFLPPPDKLVPVEDNARVTITLSKSSVEFFKKQAKQAHTHYQTMIRKVLDCYSEHYQIKS